MFRPDVLAYAHSSYLTSLYTYWLSIYTVTENLCRSGNQIQLRESKLPVCITTIAMLKAIQIGVTHELEQLAKDAGGDLRPVDFEKSKTILFPASGSHLTPSHSLRDFKFTTWSPRVFCNLRDHFAIKSSDYLQSLSELASPGTGSSTSFASSDDKYLIRTVQRGEAESLQRLLPMYYLNLKQNRQTLLPKFYGLYCVQMGLKKVRFVVTNNVIPSSIRMHLQYDLKGSSYNRSASAKERTKVHPIYKDLDFIAHTPDGLLMSADECNALHKSILSDCLVLQSCAVMNYRMLVGVHKVDLAIRENAEAEENGATMDERGIPAKNSKGESLRLFVGIMDILQPYTFGKRLERYYKAAVYDGNAVSVCKPGLYSERFKNFMCTSVFRQGAGQEVNPVADLTATPPDMILDKVEINMDLSGDNGKKTPSSANDFTPSVTSHDGEGPSPDDSRKESQCHAELPCVCQCKDGEIAEVFKEEVAVPTDVEVERPTAVATIGKDPQSSADNLELPVVKVKQPDVSPSSTDCGKLAEKLGLSSSENWPSVRKIKEFFEQLDKVQPKDKSSMPTPQSSASSHVPSTNDQAEEETLRGTSIDISTGDLTASPSDMILDKEIDMNLSSADNFTPPVTSHDGEGLLQKESQCQADLPSVCQCKDIGKANEAEVCNEVTDSSVSSLPTPAVSEPGSVTCPEVHQQLSYLKKQVNTLCSVMTVNAENMDKLYDKALEDGHSSMSETVEELCRTIDQENAEQEWRHSEALHNLTIDGEALLEREIRALRQDIRTPARYTSSSGRGPNTYTPSLVSTWSSSEEEEQTDLPGYYENTLSSADNFLPSVNSHELPHICDFPQSVTSPGPPPVCDFPPTLPLICDFPRGHADLEETRKESQCQAKFPSCDCQCQDGEKANEAKECNEVTDIPVSSAESSLPTPAVSQPNHCTHSDVHQELTDLGEEVEELRDSVNLYTEALDDLYNNALFEGQAIGLTLAQLRWAWTAALQEQERRNVESVNALARAGEARLQSEICGLRDYFRFFKNIA